MSQRSRRRGPAIGPMAVEMSRRQVRLPLRTDCIDRFVAELGKVVTLEIPPMRRLGGAPRRRPFAAGRSDSSSTRSVRDTPSFSTRRDPQPTLVWIAHQDEAQARYSPVSRLRPSMTRRVEQSSRPTRWGLPRLGIDWAAGRASDFSASAKARGQVESAVDEHGCGTDQICKQNSNSVTTPKLPPPPRSPQNRFLML